MSANLKYAADYYFYTHLKNIVNSVELYESGIPYSRYVQNCADSLECKDKFNLEL